MSDDDVIETVPYAPRVTVHRYYGWRVWVRNGYDLVQVKKASALRLLWWDLFGGPDWLPMCMPLRAAVLDAIGQS